MSGGKIPTGLKPGVLRMGIWAVVWLLMSALAGGSALAEDSPSAEGSPPAEGSPRKEMRQVFEAVSHLLPLAADEKAWADPKNSAEIDKWLATLDDLGRALEGHAERRDAGFRYLSRSLSADIAEIRGRRELGRYEESRFFMIEATGNCVACHSRLPSASSFPMADELMKQLESDSLSAHERVQILVATRQFDAALDVWEQLLMDPEMLPAQIDMGGYFLDYFTVAIRVKHDPARVRSALKKFRQRDDVPRYLDRHVAGWIVALDEVERALVDPDRLGRAKALIAGKGTAQRSLLGREGMLYDLAASSLLLQYIDAVKDDDTQLAEALYLLGLVEARSVDSYWVPQAEFHLEAAIRLAPGADFAVDAYGLLEEYVVLGYGGVSGNELPTDVWTKLRELNALIEDARSKRDANAG
jgi:hypothetical protein